MAVNKTVITLTFALTVDKRGAWLLDNLAV